MFAYATTDNTNTAHLTKSQGGWDVTTVNFIGSSNGNTNENTGGGIGGPDPIGPSYTIGNGQYSVEWQIVGSDILFKMTAEVDGWISIGISDSPLMSGSDCYTGWVNKDGSAVILDTWSPNRDLPPRDTDVGGTNDAVLIRGSQSGSTTTITFKRPLKTNDKYDFEIKNEYQYLLWGYTSGDGSTSPLLMYPTHSPSQAGAVKVNFFTGQTKNILSIEPGLVVVVIVAGILFVYTARRWIIKGIKASKVKSKKEKYESEPKKLESAPQPTFQGHSSRRYSVSSGYKQNVLFNQESEAETVAPNGRAYYRGSQKIVGTLDFSEYEKEYQDSSMEVSEAPEKSPETSKPGGNRVSRWFAGVSHSRIGDYDIYKILLAVLYVGLNIGALWAGTTWADSFGSLVAGNALLATIPATRNSVLVHLVGIPFDRTILYHRWIGRFVLILSIIHGIWEIVDWKNTGMDVLKQLALTSNIFGIVSWICLVLVFITALEVFRRKYFEFFFYTHFMFLGFFVLGALHSKKFLPYALVAAALYVLDRLVRVVWGVIPMRTTLLNLKDEKNQVVQIRFPKHKLADLVGIYKVGQYVFLNFPTISFLEWHPFSLSSGPDENTCEVHIKGLGDHTKEIVERASKKDKLWIRVDGPYGNLHFNYRRYPVILLASGGIGVTPTMGILKDLYRVGDVNPKKKAAPHTIEAVYFVWTMPSQDVYEWFSHELADIYKASTTTPGAPKFTAMLFVSKPNGEMDAAFHKGRPNYDEIFSGLVKEHPNKACSVFVCGPKPMVNSLWDCSSKFNRQGNNFDFHHETFEF